MKRGIVVQARFGSTRLPGKVLLPVEGLGLLELCALRAARSRFADQVIVATTDLPADDPIAAQAARLGLAFVRGSEADVLSRYALAARTFDLDVVCRLTSDCPFVDPDVIDAIFALFTQGGFDYASNTLRRTFPRGLDAEVFSRAAIERADAEARLPAEREHVTVFLYRHPELFSLGSFEGDEDLSSHRWTVDELDDLRLVREVAARLGPRLLDAGYREILALLRAEPSLAALNAHVGQKPVP